MLTGAYHSLLQKIVEHAGGLEPLPSSPFIYGIRLEDG